MGLRATALRTSFQNRTHAHQGWELPRLLKKRLFVVYKNIKSKSSNATTQVKHRLIIPIPFIGHSNSYPFPHQVSQLSCDEYAMGVVLPILIHRCCPSRTPSRPMGNPPPQSANAATISTIAILQAVASPVEGARVMMPLRRLSGELYRFPAVHRTRSQFASQSQ